jgi:anti-sigma factor RsiW
LGEPQRLTTEERSNLVAFIDHELPPELSRPLEAKLAQSPTVRHEVESLERTWELLDLLPRPKASNELVSRTLTLVTRLENEGASLYTTTGDILRRLMHAVIAALFVVAAVGVGYVATRWIWPDPTGRLARDLSIAEHLDEYIDVGSFEYLRMLEQAPDVFDATEH